MEGEAAQLLLDLPACIVRPLNILCHLKIDCISNRPSFKALKPAAVNLISLVFARTMAFFWCFSKHFWLIAVERTRIVGILLPSFDAVHGQPYTVTNSQSNSEPCSCQSNMHFSCAKPERQQGHQHCSHYAHAYGLYDHRSSSQNCFKEAHKSTIRS